MLDSKKTRREVLSALAASGLLLVACDEGSPTPRELRLDAALDDAMPPEDAGARDVGAQVDMQPADMQPADMQPADMQPADMAPPVEGWAAGGTASIRDKETYPDPFFAGAGVVCTLVATTTAGPCDTATDLDREDISEGWTGLPMRLGLRVVDANCEALMGALVRIWHTNAGGSYSGQTPRNDFCLLDQGFAQSDFFRGVRTTGEDGVVWFDTCFPGWYPGRAIHIHFEVQQGGRRTRVSQLTFADDLMTPIFEGHVDYVERGQPDTTVATDGVFEDLSARALAELTLDVARMTDGVMLATKTIAVV